MGVMGDRELKAVENVTFRSKDHKTSQLRKVRGVTRNTKLVFLDELLPARAVSPSQATLILLPKTGFPKSVWLLPVTNCWGTV